MRFDFLLASLFKLRIFVFLVSLALATNAFALISGNELQTNSAIQVTAGPAGTVVVFLSAKCPCSDSHIDILKKISKEFSGFSFVAIHSNLDEPSDISNKYFQAIKLPFPVIQDDNAKLADEFKAFKTPHVFVLDSTGQILYKGGVTNSNNGKTAEKQYLRDALSDIVAARPVQLAEGRTLGCIISRGN